MRRRLQRSRATAISERSKRPPRLIARGIRSSATKNSSAPMRPALRAPSILSVSRTDSPSDSATTAVASAIASAIPSAGPCQRQDSGSTRSSRQTLVLPGSEIVFVAMGCYGIVTGISGIPASPASIPTPPNRRAHPRRVRTSDPAWRHNPRGGRPDAAAAGRLPAARRARGADRHPGRADRRRLPRDRARAPALAVERLAVLVRRPRAAARGRAAGARRPPAPARRRRPPSDSTGLGTEPTPLSHAPGVALAALGTLAFGAVLGPEAPVIALGSVVGVAAARLARADERALPVLSLAGSFSAISALFGGPLVAAMLLLESRARQGRRAAAHHAPRARRRRHRLHDLRRAGRLGRPRCAGAHGAGPAGL